MPTMLADTDPSPRVNPKSDGASAPQTVPSRLLAAAIRIFAAKGYAAASTREICQAAGANVAAIHYYFGGKQGLYQAVLAKPVQDVVSRIPSAVEGAPPPSMEEALRQFYTAFLTPLIDGGDEVADLRRVTLREVVEPTQAFAEVLQRSIAPEHQVLIELLMQHCGLDAPDDALHHLAFALMAIVENYWMSLDCMRLMAPGLLANPKAYAQLIERLVGYGLALVEHERRQRRSI